MCVCVCVWVVCVVCEVWVCGVCQVWVCGVCQVWVVCVKCGCVGGVMLTENKGTLGRSRVKYRKGVVDTVSWYSSVANSNANSSGVRLCNPSHDISHEIT